jgi:hypothetical protein
LYIPYWTTPLFPGDPQEGDNGTRRPLPSGIISWLCEGIAASPYAPGQPLDVQVSVGNNGGGNATALVTVIVYWSEPVAGGLSKPTIFGAQSVPVPPRGAVAATSVMTGIVPTASPHICLFALVTHDLDKYDPLKPIDPIGDRHWAQHNLQAVTVSPKKIVHLSFTAANALLKAGAFEVEARPVPEREMELLARRLKSTPRLRTDSLRLQILDNTGRVLTEPGSTAALKLELDARGRRGLHLTLQMDETLEQHEFAAVEVLLHHRSGKRRDLAGSLGVVMRPEARQ